ncbi:ABC transporter permease [Mesoaciditoga lauensis]|uniref:ABC transporter permease n=1 Tax=Mesoaciditoga lauensis TaxID=1495039 RepID=UPI00056CEBF7|nr:ABC transporter permease [Mesoaciditoga lauensis]
MGDFLRAFFNELKIVYRGKNSIFLTVIIPIAAMILTGLIFPNIMNMQNYKIAVYNEDKGPYSNLALMLVYGMIKGDTIKRVDDLDKLYKGLDDGTYDGAVVIPKGFSDSVKKGEKFHLAFVPSAVNIQTSVIIYDTLKTLFSEIGNAVVVRNVLELYKNPKDRVEIIPPSLTIAGPYGENMNYVNFMIPSLAILIAMASVAITLSSSISYERENGVLKVILISTVNRNFHILGKIAAHTVDGTVKGLFALITAQIFFSSGLQNPVRTIFMLLMGTFAFAGIGMIISILSPNQRISNAIMIGYIFPSIFLSGVFIPIHQMPRIAQLFSKAFPLTFASDALQRINVLGYTISNVFNADLFPILLYVGASLFVSILLFNNIENVEEIS